MQRALLPLIPLLIISATAAAQDVPRKMTYQGRLVRSDGTPETAPQDLKFALYSQPTGGAPLWEETHAQVALTNGYYAAVLGKSVALPSTLVTGQELFLGVSVGNGAELLPRTAVVSVPYALKASEAFRLEGRAATDFALAAHSHGNATSTAAGFMSSADKARFDAIPFDLSGNGLTQNGTGSGSSLNVDFNAVAARVHSHTMTCRYRSATGNENGGVTAFCAPGETLTGGGCEDVDASAALGITGRPVGVTMDPTADAGLGTAGYLCQSTAPGTETVTSWAVCCRVP